MKQEKWRNANRFENKPKVIRFVGEMSQIWTGYPVVIQRIYEHFGDDFPSPNRSWFSIALTRGFVQTRRVNNATPLIPGRDEILARCCLSNVMYGLMEIAKFQLSIDSNVWDYRSQSYWDWKGDADVENIIIKEVSPPLNEDWGWLVEKILSKKDIKMIGEDAVLVFSGIVM